MYKYTVLIRCFSNFLFVCACIIFLFLHRQCQTTWWSKLHYAKDTELVICLMKIDLTYLKFFINCIQLHRKKMISYEVAWLLSTLCSIVMDQTSSLTLSPPYLLMMMILLVNMMSTTASPTSGRTADNIAACTCNRKSKSIFVFYLCNIRLTVMFLIFIFYKSREMSW